jgi:hypothetical protein
MTNQREINSTLEKLKSNRDQLDTWREKQKIANMKVDHFYNLQKLTLDYLWELLELD